MSENQVEIGEKSVSIEENNIEKEEESISIEANKSDKIVINNFPDSSEQYIHFLEQQLERVSLACLNISKKYDILENKFNEYEKI